LVTIGYIDGLTSCSPGCRLAVHCEMPTPRLYHFDGAVVDRLDPAAPHEPLTADNLLLRGCTLRKTVWVVGAVPAAQKDAAPLQLMLSHLLHCGIVCIQPCRLVW
jgi:hypothetical protein